MLSAIILAAGESRRFGSLKALAIFDNARMSVIDYLISNMLKVDNLEIIVVLGAHAQQIQAVLLKHINVRIVYNKNYNFGQASSFQKGLSVVSKESRGYLMQPVDCPLIKTETMTEIISSFNDKSPRILIPTYQGKKGHPPVFSASCKESLMALDSNIGLNQYQQDFVDQTLFLETSDKGVIQTFNTRDEFERIKSLHSGIAMGKIEKNSKKHQSLKM